MNTALNEAEATCPNCGGALPKGSLEGLCPACLLDAGVDTKTAEGPARKGVEPPPITGLARLFPQLSILQLIGAGGMGAVYKARQPALDRLVALKILPPGDADGINFAERFNREARALARLSHPNIVAVHEFGHVQDLHYFIMEYVDGVNLRQLEQKGRLSPREALQIIPQICDALQYAHDEGVVHRDIKPENVLVDRKGRVKIADFGLAKILGIDAEQARLTAEGQVMGTPHYMAPEQIERPLHVDHRADIYSLGVVFYEMLTGDLPLGKFPPPSRKISVDVRLDEVVLRSLENDPTRRYQRASEVKSELQTITEEPAPAAPPPTPGEPVANKPIERLIHWAGIPLAVDREGEREITWNGGLTAVGTGAVLTAIGLSLFHFITDLPTPSMAGIPLVITIFILGAGFRWVMKTPLPDERNPELAEHGTVILRPTRLRLNWGFLAMAGILPAMFAWGLVLNYGFPALKRSFRTLNAAQVATLDRATGTMAVDLPGRGRVELLAVSYADPAPNQWWRPDGTPVTNELWQIENPGTASYSNAFVVSTNRQLILRVSDLPDDARGPSLDFGGQVTSVSGGYVLKGDTHPRGANGVLIGIPPQLRTTDMRVGFGLQPWRVVATKDPRRQSSNAENLVHDPRWNVIFNNTADTKEGVQVTIVMKADDRNWNQRIVAVDTNGTEHSHSMGTGTPAGDSMAWTYTFRKLPLDQVREFRIEVQPVHWVAFRDIRLNPNQSLPAPKRIAFTPVREITTSDFIDFDTGNVMEEPPGTGRNVFDSLSATVGWMQRNGLDAAVGNGELQPLGMIFVALENSDWDSFTPTDLTTKLHQGNYVPHTLKPWKNGELPSTFGFRTREGGTGILQLVAFEPDRPGVTLRYKLIKRPSLNIP